MSAEVFTGSRLSALEPVPTFEPAIGRYCFRAERGVRYSIRIAASHRHPFYEFTPTLPSLEDIYDFAAVEELRFEDVGRAWASDAGDGIPNVRKFVFGMHPAFPLDHPANAPLRDRLPRQVLRLPGIPELVCRPDSSRAPDGDPRAAVPPAEISRDLESWAPLVPTLLPDGTLRATHPGDDPAGFLRWDVLKKQAP
jgi:hypothetical protein